MSEQETSQQSLSLQDKLKLESWGLPRLILQKYQSKGLRSMFPWQLECLTSGNVLQGGNLVYSAPTSAGKTLIAEILTFQTVLERKKKVIIILPFVSVVREKMLYFQDLFAGSGVRVEGFMGSYNPPGGFRAVHVAICTIEKANSLINRLLEENNFDNIGCVVVDELHLLGDPHRGYLLELLLTKLKYISKKGLCSPIQIVGMSATLPNLDVLAKWLDATLYKTDFRPIPLVEYVKVERVIYKAPDLKSNEIFTPEFSVDKDPGDVIYLCIDTILKGFSVLVFCPTKNWCETLALQIAGEVKKLGCSSSELAQDIRNQLNSEAISDTLEQLKNSPVGLESVLGKCISFGVAFHHAGLTLDERDIIEGCFRKSVVRVLVATSTLSSGVNLPARRVIIRSPLFNGRLMDILSYKQMVGRAGRMGRDTAGESYLLCTEENKSQGERLVTSQLPAVESCLGNSDLSSSLKRAVLEVIASGLISSYKEVECYTNCTLLAAYESAETIHNALQKCIQYLSTKGFIDVRNETEISASSLAEACLSASMTPDQGLKLLAELDKARKCFVLESDLHAVYQVTPFSVSNQWTLDWMKAFSLWEKLPKGVQKVGHMVGVEDRFLIRAMRGTMNFQGDVEANRVAIHKRFFTALALQDLINEIPLTKVAEKYGCTKGVLQSLQQSASTFSGMVTNFCRKLGWGALEVVVSQLGQRIQFGAHRDLLDLLRLECMTGSMARGLHKSGVTTVAELAKSTLKDVAAAVRKSLPYASLEDEGKRKEKRDIYLPGRPGLTELEAADLFIKEARSFIMREMGLDHVEWNDPKPSDNVYDMTTVGPDSKRLEQSDVSLNLSVTSADFNVLNEDPDLKIGLAIKIPISSTQVPVANVTVPIDEGVEGVNIGTRIEETPFVGNVGEGASEHEESTQIDDTEIIEERAPTPTDPVEQNDENDTVEIMQCIEDDNRIIDNEPKISVEEGGTEANEPKCQIGNGVDNDEPVTSVEEVDTDIEEDINPKFTTLLDISNPCIPKIDKTLVSSSLDWEPDVADDVIVPPSQDLLPSQFPVDLVTSNQRCSSKPNDVMNNVTDYGNLEFSNFSKVFGKSFSHASPIEKEKAVGSQLKPLIKSSTPIQTPGHVGSFLETRDVEMPGIEKFSAIARFSSVYDKSSTPRTPDNAHLDRGNASGITPEASEPSDVDMFNDSKPGNRLSSSMMCAIHSEQPLEEMDSNWGGDSILLASQVIENHKESAARISMKRTLDCSEGKPAKKRRMLSISSTGKSSKRNSASKYFADSLILDTQAAQIVDDNFSGPLTILPAETRDIQPVHSPSPNFDRSNQARNSLTDSFLADAFQDSFKNSEEPIKKAEPGTPEMFESPENVSVAPKEPLKKFPNTGLISFDNEKMLDEKKAKSSSSPDKSSNVPPVKVGIPGEPLAKLAPAVATTSSAAVTPRKKSRTPKPSPSKYPTVGVSFIKGTRSPGSPSGRKTPSLEQFDKKSCKKSLLLSGASPSGLPSITSDETSEQLCDPIDPFPIATSTIKPMISEPLPVVGPLPLKKFKKARSENWGQPTTVDENLITAGSSEHSSAPMAPEIANIPTISGLVDLSKLSETVNVCTVRTQVEQFIGDVLKHREAAVLLETTQVSSSNSKIGLKIVGSKSSKELDPDFHQNGVAVIGLCFTWGAEVFRCCLRSSKCICLTALKSIFLRKDVTIIGFDLMWQIKLLHQCCRFEIECKLWDVSVADWLLNPRDGKPSLKQLSRDVLCAEETSCAHLQKTQCATDALLIWGLKKKLSMKLTELGLLDTFIETEMPIRLLLVYMELSGMPFDQNIATHLWNRVRETMSQLEEQIYVKAKSRFSLSSRKDLKKVKESLNIKAEDVNHPLLVSLHSWRKLNSLKTRNLSQLLMTPLTDGRCRGQHCSFTVTGRIVMVEPNLQHVPRDFTVNKELFSLRSAFVAKPGNVILSADYSQLELRILAHFAQDSDLLSSIHKEADVFVSIAAKWNNIPLDQVTDDIRHQTKQIIYGIIYGMGDRTLGDTLGVEPPEAAMLAAKFRQSYPGVQKFIQKCIADCRKHGHITTLTGRVRRLSGINSPNKSSRAQAERQAVNSTIQGSAADIAKSATVRIESKLADVIPNRGPVLTPLSASHLILHLHDELMYEVNTKYLDLVKDIVKTEMTNAVQLRVPLPVVVKCGPSWGQLKKL